MSVQGSSKTKHRTSSGKVSNKQASAYLMKYTTKKSHDSIADNLSVGMNKLPTHLADTILNSYMKTSFRNSARLATLTKKHREEYIAMLESIKKKDVHSIIKVVKELFGNYKISSIKSNQATFNFYKSLTKFDNSKLNPILLVDEMLLELEERNPNLDLDILRNNAKSREDINRDLMDELTAENYKIIKDNLKNYEYTWAFVNLESLNMQFIQNKIRRFRKSFPPSVKAKVGLEGSAASPRLKFLNLTEDNTITEYIDALYKLPLNCKIIVGL